MKTRTRQGVQSVLIHSLGILLLAGLLGAAPPGPAFTAAEQQAMTLYRQNFQAIRTQAQLLASLHASIRLSKTLEQRLQAYMDELQRKDSYPEDKDLTALAQRTPGLQPVLVAEGTALVLATDYEAFAKAAAGTPEKADDAYFALMKKAYGSAYTYWGNWFNQTWDYGGCTWLGKGTHLALLKELYRQKGQKSPFSADLAQLETELLNDLEKSDKFCLPRPQVVHELRQIVPMLPTALRPRLQKRLQRVETDSRLKEFDCNGKGQCSYG